MDHLLPEYTTAATIFVTSAAICFGVAAAKLRFPSVQTQLRRGDCPECKARKSLRTTPINAHSLMFTCGECVSQWLVENPDDEIVVFGPSSQPVLPALQMIAHDNGYLEFRTDVGIALFYVPDLPEQHRDDFFQRTTPRNMIRWLFSIGFEPKSVDLIPAQRLQAVVAECTPYQWFAASAGVDIYHLMPGNAANLHGTTESTHE